MALICDDKRPSRLSMSTVKIFTCSNDSCRNAWQLPQSKGTKTNIQCTNTKVKEYHKQILRVIVYLKCFICIGIGEVNDIPCGLDEDVVRSKGCGAGGRWGRQDAQLMALAEPSDWTGWRKGWYGS